MHSRDSEKSDAEFHEEIDRILAEAGTGTADFSGFSFPKGDFCIRQFVATCDFSGASFLRSADFSGAKFERFAFFQDASFHQAAMFEGSQFSRGANFCDARFGSTATFRRAKFTENADFSQTRFSKSASFIESTFAQALFTDAIFDDRADFALAAFIQDAVFVGVAFKDSVSFYSAKFARGTHFRKATFSEGADFRGTGFAELVDFTRARFLKGVEFRATEFRCDASPSPGPVFLMAEFLQPERTIFSKAYLGQALFNHCDVSKVSFVSVDWRRRKGTGRRFLFEEAVDLNVDSARTLRLQGAGRTDRDFELIEGIYQQLKKNYEDARDYSTAGDFHYGEMEMKRLSSYRTNAVARWAHSNLGLAAWYKYASQYGESYRRPAAWLVFVLVACALVFPAIGMDYSLHSNNGTGVVSALTYWHPVRPDQAWLSPFSARLRLVGNSLVTSVDVAAFQKDPAYRPTYPWGRVLTTSEMILTSTLVALFLLAVRRQFRR